MLLTEFHSFYSSNVMSNCDNILMSDMLKSVFTMTLLKSDKSNAFWKLWQIVLTGIQEKQNDFHPVNIKQNNCNKMEEYLFLLFGVQFLPLWVW